MSTLATLVVKLTADISQFDKNIKSASQKLDQVGLGMRKAGMAMTAGVTVPLVGVGAAAIKAGQDLDRSMANVASLGVATERVQELKGSVQELAVETGKSTGDMTAGLYQVVSAFGDTGDTMEILEINAKAAAAGLAKTEEAINLTSAVMKGYGDVSAESAQRTADLALKTVQLGQTTFPELAASIGRVVPITANLGVSQEELFATMATLTGVTGSAAEVSTQLRGAMQALMAPTTDMQALINDLGYESGQAMLEQLGLQGSIEAMVTAAEESSMPLQKLIGSIEGQTLALALAGPQAETYQEKLAAMQAAAGATDEAFTAQTEGVNKNGFAMQQMKVQMEVAAQKLYVGLIPALQAVLEQVTPLIDKVVLLADKFAGMDPKTQTAIVALGAVAAAIGPVLIVLGSLASGISVVTGAISGAGGLVAVLGLPLAPLAAIVAAVALLVVAWKRDWGGIQEKTGVVMDAIMPLLKTVGDWLSMKIPAAVAAASQTWNEILLPALQVVAGFLNENIVPLLKALAHVWLAVVKLEVKALAAIWKMYLLPALQKIGSFLKDELQFRFDLLVAVLGKLHDIAKKVKDKSIGPLTASFKQMKDALGWITDKLDGFGDKLNGLSLPDWLTPGSPTPFETGLWGINEAAATLARSGMPMLKRGLDEMAAMIAPNLTMSLATVPAAGGLIPAPLYQQAPAGALGAESGRSFAAAWRQAVLDNVREMRQELAAALIPDIHEYYQAPQGGREALP